MATVAAAAATPATTLAAPLLLCPVPVAAPLTFVDGSPTRGFTVALAATVAARAGDDIEPFAVFTAGDTVGLRTFEIDAAVGLLNRSAALLLRVAFLTGVGNGGAALRDLAKDAAVGANKPDEGVLGRGVVFDGVLGRTLVAEGVLGRLGVALDDDLAYLVPEGVETAAVDLVDVPVCCGLRV